MFDTVVGCRFTMTANEILCGRRLCSISIEDSISDYEAIITESIIISIYCENRTIIFCDRRSRLSDIPPVAILCERTLEILDTFHFDIRNVDRRVILTHSVNLDFYIFILVHRIRRDEHRVLRRCGVRS